MSMLSWRIYYSDDSTFDSSQGEPHESPPLGVQAIVQPDPDMGRVIEWGKDYYWWVGDRWDGGDLFGLFDYLSQPGVKVVRFGRSMSNAAFRAVYARAVADQDFPHKSAMRSDERPPV